MNQLGFTRARCRVPIACRRQVGLLSRALLVGVAAWMAGMQPLQAIRGTDKPALGDPEWEEAQSLFAGLEKLGLPDVRGALLVCDLSKARAGGWGQDGLGLAWLLPPEEGLGPRVIRDQVDAIEVRLWGRLAIPWTRPGSFEPARPADGMPVVQFDGEVCDGTRAVGIVRGKVQRGRTGTGGNRQSKVTRWEAEAFLLAANLSRTGRDQPARQVLQLLGTDGERLQSFANEAEAMVVRARANTLVRQHILQPNWSELTTALRQLLSAAPSALSDHTMLERLAERTAARGTEVFGSADRYAHLSEAERTLVNRLANEVPPWQYFENRLWVACQWEGMSDQELRPEGALAEVLRQGPASLPLLAACLGDQRPVLFTHGMRARGQPAGSTTLPMLMTMDEMVRTLLINQMPRGDVPESEDDKEGTNALRSWCLRAAQQSRFALARRILEAGSYDQRVEVAEWLALRETSGRGLEIFREWLPRQPDDWMRVQGFLLLYDALGRHGSQLKDLLAEIRPRLLAMDEPVDAAQRAIGHAWDMRRELSVLDRMSTFPTPLEGLLAVIAEGGISTSRCRERLPRVLLHTPPEKNITTVLAELPRFRWACEAERVLASLRRSGGTFESSLGALHHRRPPLAYGEFVDAWMTAFADQRDLFTCLPQFSATLGEAAAWACLAIHGAEDRSRYGPFPILSERSVRSADVALAQALLRGEVKLRGTDPPKPGPSFVSTSSEIPWTFVVGRFLGVPASERTAFLNELAAADRAALRTFLVAPNTLAGATDLPPSIHPEMCASASTMQVLLPTASDHPLRRLAGRRLTDETMTEILRHMSDGLAKGQNEVTTLRLNDTLDGVSLVSRPLDLAAMAFEVVSSGDGADTWITQWLQHGPLGPESESMNVDQRRLLIVSLVSRSDSFLSYPVSLTKRLLDKNLLPPALAETTPSEAAYSGESNHVRGDVDDNTQTKASLLLWRNLRALLRPYVPAPAAESGSPPPFIPCEGIVLWTIDPAAMRSALLKP